MEQANQRLWPIAGGDGISNFSQISHEVGNVMLVQIAHGVPAVVSQIKHEQVETVGEQGPQRQIEIAGESIAMGEQDAGTAGIAIAAEADRRSVLHRNNGPGGRSGKGNHR